MSTLASKTEALERHRRAVARELAELELGPDIICANCTGTGIDFDVDCNAAGCETVQTGYGEGRLRGVHDVHHAGPNCESTCTLCEGKGTGRAALALALLTDTRQGFDVHAAREHARALIAKGLDLTTGPEHDVWTDWRAWWAGKGRTPDECPATASGHGAQYARLGQRILDMLEGQPSECEGGCWINGVGVFMRTGAGQGPSFYPRECPDCHGTGHNLLGKLPKVEWSPAVRRSLVDHAQAVVSGPSENRPSWKRSLAQTSLVPLTDDAWKLRTRVCPRGEHRTAEDPNERAWGFTGLRAEHDLGGYKTGEQVRVCGYGKGRWRPRTTHDKPEHACTPAWRRGEIEHARQRREREARRRPVIAYEPSRGQLFRRARRAVDAVLSSRRVTWDAQGCAALEAAVLAELGDDVAGASVELGDSNERGAVVTLHAHPELEPFEGHATFTV